MKPIIETQNLSFRFGSNVAVRDLTFQVPEGSICAFLGLNGAGKTTTIKMLMNILRPSGGTARLMGVDSKKLRSGELANLGYVSENRELPEWMTVRRLLSYCKPMYPTWDDAFCDKLVKDFNLPLDAKLKNLSMGMKVKASLISSIAYRPKLLILDAPFSGLDPLVRDEFIRGMLELSGESGSSVFVSSHDIDEVDKLADWVVILNEGHLHLSESTESLQTRFRQVLLTVDEEISRLPENLPASWLIPESSDRTVRLVESRYEANETPETLRRVFPGAGELTFAPMSLKEIFLTLAKSFRATTEV